MFVAGRQGPAEIPDRRRGGGDCAVDVCGDQCLRRSRLFVFGFCYMARGRILSGVGFPLIFVSITSASYEVSGPIKPLGLRPDFKRAVVLRAVPSDLARDRTLPSSVQYQGTLHPKTRYFVWQGSPLVEARQQTIAWSSSRCSCRRHSWPVRFLGADTSRAGVRCARTGSAQGQAGARRACQSLMDIQRELAKRRSERAK
jgi:hypothetical protein